MSDYALHIHDDRESVAHEMASRVIELSAGFTGPRSIALCGGTTPKKFYEFLATELSHSNNWADIEFFFGDERSVPPTDSQSNYRMAYEALLGPLAIAETKIHRMEGEREDLDNAARDYERVIRETLKTDAQGTPIIDLMLLGMGDDGHTASLFPHTSALQERERLVVPNYVPKLETHRLTMTFPLITAARHILFLVSGGSKAAALRSVLEGEHDVQELPSQQVLRGAGAKVEWWLDAAAASDLSR